MALSIDMNLNARQVQAEAKNVSRALEEVSDSLDDIATESQRSGSKAERALDGIGDSAKSAGKGIESAADRAEKSFSDLVSDAKRADKAIENIGTSGKAGFGGANEAAKELSSEIGQNLGETVSSFRGDLSDLGQVGQDTLGGLAATMSSTGPAGVVGAAALAAGALGLGALTAGLEEAKEKQEAVNEAAAKFADGYINGINGALSAASVFAEINSIATDPDRYQQAKDAAEEWGVSVQVAMGALAGDTTALGLAQQSLADRSAEANQKLLQQEKQVDQNAGATYDLADSVKAGTERMQALTDAMELGRKQADDQAGALYNYASRVGVATEKTDELGNTIWELPDGKEIVVDAKTQRAYEDLNALDSKRLADKQFAIRATVDTSAWDNWKPGDKVGGVRTAIRPGSGGGTTWF